MHKQGNDQNFVVSQQWKKAAANILARSFLQMNLWLLYT